MCYTLSTTRTHSLSCHSLFPPPLNISLWFRDWSSILVIKGAWVWMHFLYVKCGMFELKLGFYFIVFFFNWTKMRLMRTALNMQHKKMHKSHLSKKKKCRGIYS